MAHYDEDDAPDYEYGEPVEVKTHVNPPEAERIPMFPPDEVVAQLQAELEERAQQRKKRAEKTKTAKKKGKDLGIYDPHAGELASAGRMMSQMLAPPAHTSNYDAVERELEEIRSQARQRMTGVIGVLDDLLSSENEKIRKEAADRLFDIGYGKVGTMERPVDPNKDIAIIIPVWYRDLDDPHLFEVPEID